MIQINDFILLSPDEATPDKGVPIRLIPTNGRFYGQGWRPATQHYLREIGRLVKPGMTILDFGCGTGVLAIAAAKLGATVVAIENDPEVLQYAKEQFALNEVDIFLGTESPQSQFDLVVANLDQDDLQANLPMLQAAVREGGIALWRQ